MRYKEFIRVVTQNQTEKVKALSIPESSAPDSIPTKIGTLLPDVLNIIDKNFNALADGMPTIGVFGFQPIGFTNKSTYQSSPATLLNHLWCVIYYLPTHSINAVKSWANFKTIVIDFTKGLVIDKERYLHCVLHGESAGKIYGKINSKKLDEVWKNVETQKFLTEKSL